MLNVIWITKTLEVMLREYSWSNLKFFRWRTKLTVREHIIIVTLHNFKSIHDLVTGNNEILIFIQNFHTLSSLFNQVKSELRVKLNTWKNVVALKLHRSLLFWPKIAGCQNTKFQSCCCCHGNRYFFIHPRVKPPNIDVVVLSRSYLPVC